MMEAKTGQGIISGRVMDISQRKKVVRDNEYTDNILSVFKDDEKWPEWYDVGINPGDYAAVRAKLREEDDVNVLCWIKGSKALYDGKAYTNLRFIAADVTNTASATKTGKNEAQTETSDTDGLGEDETDSLPF